VLFVKLELVFPQQTSRLIVRVETGDAVAVVVVVAGVYESEDV
jgi:hypothetical protein